MLHQADGQLADLILAAISSRPERNIYSERCNGSGVKLLGILYAECDIKLNSGSHVMIVDGINALSACGFEFATTAGFLDYREQMCALNNSLNTKLRKNEDRLTADYESAITRAGLEQAFKLKVMEH